MKINQIKKGMKNIFLKARVVEKSETKEVWTKYGLKRVADITLEDETGRIKMALWEERIDKVSVGDKIEVRGAFSKIFKGKVKLSLPKSGSIRVIE